MRTNLILAAALAVTVAVPAMAQEMGKSGSSSGQTSQQQAAAMQQSNTTQASALIGKRAYGPSGESIGEINDILISPSGQVQAAVVDVGGFLGMGQHSVRVDWGQVKVSQADNRVSVNLTKDQLKAAPEFKSSSNLHGTTGTAPQSSQLPSSQSGTSTSPKQ